MLFSREGVGITLVVSWYQSFNPCSTPNIHLINLTLCLLIPRSRFKGSVIRIGLFVIK